jgi:two-component system, cell cycle response regulator CpdR
MIRILLAEDDDAMRAYLARALENAGYDVVAVECGTAAMPWLETQDFDLFITGFAAVSLRAGREAPQAKVLSKPFHLRDLVIEVQRMFGQSAQASI